MHLVLDQGTSSTKVFLFNSAAEIKFSSRLPHRLTRSAPGHAESDPLHILETCYRLIKEAVDFCQKSGQTINSAGMAVQRSTFLFWDKATARPLTPAISWQDTRSEDQLDSLVQFAEMIQDTTGTPLSAHFGGPKYLHLVRNNPDLQQRIDQGSVYFGPLSAFLSQSLTGIAAVDHSIAGRSLFMRLDNPEWDDRLCNLFKVNKNVLPPLQPTLGYFGTISIDSIDIPMRCVIGDQQAALLGQGGWLDGDLALNFGTSGSVMLNTGQRPGQIPGLISSVLYSTDHDIHYLLEGTINTCNSLFDWLERDLGISVHRRNWDKLCQKTTTEGVVVPGYCGLAAPYWQDCFDTIIRNIDVTDTDQIIRASIESIGYFTRDIIRLIKNHLPIKLGNISASGGLSRTSLLQFIADLLDATVGQTSMKDHTALGVLQLLRKADGYPVEKQAFDHLYKPSMSANERQAKISVWQQALRQAGIEPVK